MVGEQQFGGDWTEDKLVRVRKYLSAYATTMNKYPFKFAYIDAFAGTGYREAKKLDDIFGTPGWREVFYRTEHVKTLFGEEEYVIKDADFTKISDFFVNRLKTIFAGTAENPKLLRNSKNNPLYLLCFASGNPRGSKTAIKIAQNILRK